MNAFVWEMAEGAATRKYCLETFHTSLTSVTSHTSHQSRLATWFSKMVLKFQKPNQMSLAKKIAERRETSPGLYATHSWCQF